MKCRNCGAEIKIWFCVVLCDPCLTKRISEIPENKSQERKEPES